MKQIGAATLPLGRLIAVTPVVDPIGISRGHLDTVILKLPPQVTGLSINARIPEDQKRSSILIVLQDPQTNQALSGYSIEDAVPLHAQDSAEIRCRWDSRAASVRDIAASLSGDTIRIRFILTGRAKLFSFRFHAK